MKKPRKDGTLCPEIGVAIRSKRRESLEAISWSREALYNRLSSGEIRCEIHLITHSDHGREDKVIS